MQIFLDRDRLYVAHEGVGPLIVLDEGEAPASAYHLPEEAIELCTHEGATSAVLDQARHMLSAVKMSQTARREVERILAELDPMAE